MEPGSLSAALVAHGSFSKGPLRTVGIIGIIRGL